jgi:phenylacetate-CoA ligase
MLEFVARRTLEMNASPAPDAVRTAWNGGEMLFQQQSELFRKAFGVPILNLYGGRELSAIACQFERNAPLTVFRPWLFLEIVDEHDKPVAAGESGRLLLTSTVCRGTPFLRYDIGDLGAYDGEGKGEAGITALSELHGRAAGVLELPNGKKVNCLYWNHMFKDQPEVRQFQVVLHENGSLQLLLKGEKMTPDKESQLLTTVGKFLGDLPVRIDWVERIPLTSQGKLLQVVSEK